MNGPVIALCLGGYGSCEEFSHWVIRAMEALIMANRTWLARHPNTPLLYASGVRYRREPPSWVIEHFDSIPIVLKRRWGDCDDLVAWRIAELRNKLDPNVTVLEHPSFPRVRTKFKQHVPTKRWLYHVQVRHPDMSVEDPSSILGMKGPGI